MVTVIVRLLPAVKSSAPASACSGEYRRSMLVPFGTDLYFADGPDVSFFGFPYPTRMTVKGTAGLCRRHHRQRVPPFVKVR